MTEIKLSELAFAVFLYSGLSDKSYEVFLESTRPSLDIDNPTHVKALLGWLRRWGCRQFALKSQEKASKEIREWYRAIKHGLFPSHRHLWELSDREMEFSHNLYEQLRHRVASRKAGRVVDVGPTGAAKILFALRPHALVPWDGEIMRHFAEKESVESYGAFLRNIRSKLETLSVSCERNGFSLVELPKELGRLHSTVPKLIDEYLWVTITRRIVLPKPETLRRWLSWVD